MVLSVFLDDFRFGDEQQREFARFDFYYYYVIWLLFVIHYISKRKELPNPPSWFLGGILVLFSISFLAGALSDTLKFSMIKQILGIAYSSYAYFALIKYTNFDLPRLFGLYLRIANIIAIIGIVEQSMHIFGLDIRFQGGPIEKALRMVGLANVWDNYKPVSLGLYRVYSIMGEPYFLAVVLLPAFYYYLNIMFGTRNIRNWGLYGQFTLISATLFMTFSTAGYTGILLSAGMLAANKGWLNPSKYGLIFLPLFVFLIIPKLGSLRKSFFELQVRVDDTIKAFASQGNMTKDEMAKLNSSSFALYSNFLIAGKSFEEHPLIGSGLGSHAVNYDRYFDQFLDARLKKMYGKFNTKDANSLFIRLMSEAGLIGLIILGLAVFRFFIFTKGINNPDLAIYTLINQGVFIMFVVRILRTGNYIGQGFFFFFFLYAFSAIYIRNYYKNNIS
jgi:hypothetical protein